MRRFRPGPRVGRIVAGLAMIWLAVAGVQHLRGWPGWTVTVPVRTGDIRPEPKQMGVWKAPVPTKYRGWLSNQRGRLLEDGERIGRRSASISGVLKETGGIFAVHNAFVRWRQADVSDPRRNGKSYVLQLPAPVPRWTLGAGLGVLAWAWTARRSTLEPVPRECCRKAAWLDLWAASVVMVVAAGVNLARVPEAMQTNDGGMMIKGLPYSDAACWHEMSVSLAEGRGLASGFDGQRPWYSVMIAMLHAARGVAVENGLIINALGLGLAAGLLVATGRLLGSRVAGLGAAGVLLLSYQHRQSAAALLTETSGLALTVLSVALILAAVGIKPESGRRRWIWMAGLGLGGLFQALGNLACPYTLAAAPFYGMLLLAEGRRVRGTWKDWRILQPGLIYAAGFLLVLGPWVARQHRVHGLATLSTQTAELLYGGTFDEGPLKPRQMRELHDHLEKTGYSVAEKYRFSMQRFLETAGADPVKYVRRLGAGALAFFGYFNVTGPEPAAAVVLVVLAVLWKRRRETARLAWLATGVVVGAGAVWLVRFPSTQTGPYPLLILTLTAAVLAWTLGPRAGRVAVLWVAATLAGCVLINALTGNLIANRCWIFCDWCLWLLVLSAVYGTCDHLGIWFAATLRRPAEGEELDLDLSGSRRFTLGMAGVVVLAKLVGASLLVYGHARPAVFAQEPHAEDYRRVQAWAEEKFDREAEASGFPLKFIWARAGEGACYLSTNEEATRFSRAFASQPRPRTLRLMRGIPPGPGAAAPGWMVRMPGDAREIPEDRPGLLVAWMSVDREANLGHDEEMLEGLAFLPGDAAGRIDETQAVLFYRPKVKPPVAEAEDPPPR